jgi:hypothetical protein
MEKYKEKMEDFVSRLWVNPNLRNISVLKKENQILSFIKENSEQLKNTLSRPQYFPDISWEDTIRLLFSVLTEKVIIALEPRVSELVNQISDPEFLDFYAKTHHDAVIDTDALRIFIMQNLRNKSMRDQFVCVLDAAEYRFFEKYLPIILERRKVIYYELIRRDRLAFPEHLVPVYLNFAAVFRPFFWYKFQVEEKGSHLISLSGVARNKKSYPVIKSHLIEKLQSRLGSIPAEIINSGLDSWQNSHENEELSGAARLISVFLNRVSDFDPAQKAERGAETPDKSWFNINRRTAGYYGYDTKFLDELHSIAGEEGW